MTGDRKPTRERWASRLRSVALVAVLAIGSSALLPLVHGATSHLSECAVCCVFAHNGSSVADLVAQPDVSPPSAERAPEAFAPTTPLTHASLDSSEARAPPATSVSI